MHNALKTFALLAGMTALFGFAGLAVAGTSGAVIALGFASVLNAATWWFSDKIVLSLYRAKEVKEGRVYDIVQELAERAKLPMPKVCVMETNQPNAFATGRNPKKGVVVVTSGIMNMLDDRELRGVLGHELSHIKNRDTLTTTVAATMAGALSILGHTLIYSGGRSRNNNGGNVLLGIAVAAVAIVVAPLVQLAISRTREYEADHDGAEISDDPKALASALEKIDSAARGIANPIASENPATAHMFIVNPLKGKSGGKDSFFSTHPATENRVKALYNLATEKEKGIKTGKMIRKGFFSRP